MGVAEEHVRASIARTCAAAPDSRALRVKVLGTLRRVVPFDWYVWVGTDPRTAIGVDPVAEVPDLRLLPTIIRLKYATAVNRWTELSSAARLGARAAASPLWRDVQRDAGIVDVASVCFRDRFGCWGFLDLWSRTEFPVHRIRLLDELAPSLTGALRERQAQALRRRPEAPLVFAGPAVVLLDDDLTVTGLTPSASDLLARLLPQPDGRPSVPAAAYNVAAQLLAAEAGVHPEKPEGRLHLAEGHWITVRASRMSPGTTIAVSLERLPPNQRLDLCVRAFGLTEREAQVVTAIAGGASSSEIGRDLYLSVYTVQDHLKSIFAKTGARSRRELVPLVLGSESLIG